jgi:hypothetical protein
MYQVIKQFCESVADSADVAAVQAGCGTSSSETLALQAEVSAFSSLINPAIQNINRNVFLRSLRYAGYGLAGILRAKSQQRPLPRVCLPATAPYAGQGSARIQQ